MSEKHMPGPWKVVGNEYLGDDFHQKHAVQDEEVGYILAVVMTDCQTLQKCGEANARLIAAAPEMLEALIAVVSVADRATVEFDKARAAIAKATGA